MNDRVRGKMLFIVEGYHEKDKFLGALLRTFPEICNNSSEIIMYGTNIYMLYNDIIKEYGQGWLLDDIDLPFIISKKKNNVTPYYKNDFKDVILIFDYERHDPNFSEDKISEMQKYFNNVEDVGKLYINYPMIEAYQHLDILENKNQYLNEKFQIDQISNGAIYKSQVKGTIVENMILLSHKLNDILEKHMVYNSKVYVEELLNLQKQDLTIENIEIILADIDLDKKRLQTLKYLFRDKLSNCMLCNCTGNYYDSMREKFKEIIRYNIVKSEMIQNQSSYDERVDLRSIFHQLDLSSILSKQNITSSQESKPFIWILSACVFIIPDYRFDLIE